MRRRRIISGRIRRLKPKTACMRCMHQKTDYARYARTQLRKRLHTMHTETRIGVSVGLRGCKCMQLRMHTKCIQNAYKHKQREKRGFFLLLLLYIVCFFIFHCPFSRQSSSAVRVFRHSRTPSSLVARPFGSQQTAIPYDLYALYASKNRLCTLCENTTPELTAYNAYKKTVWLRSRAEGTKMYALKDAYRLHTKCIQVSTNT